MNAITGKMEEFGIKKGHIGWINTYVSPAQPVFVKLPASKKWARRRMKSILKKWARRFYK